MPLLNKKPFQPNPVPSDLDPDEELFVCQPTKEVFRDYEQFFNRHFLCNSLVWTCELTGQTNLTYTQALQSEEEARKLVESLPESLQKAALNLVHHTRRTNVRTLADEICAFLRQRFVQGESVDMTQTTTSGAKILTPVRVLKVIPPSPTKTSPSSPLKSPVRVPVITLSPFKKPLSPPPSSSIKSPPPLISDNQPLTNNVSATSTAGGGATPQPTQNGLPSSHSPPADSTPAPSTSGTKPKTPKTPLTPLSPEVSFDPANYRYVVTVIDEPESKLQVKASQLVRAKGVLTPKKLKMFLRNALYRMSEKHPFAVKDEYVQRFSLGPSSVDFTVLPSPVTKSNRKRSLSQASLDSFLTPGGAATPNSSTGSERKKPRPNSLGSSEVKARRKSTGKKTPKTPSDKTKKRRKSKSMSKTPKSPKAMVFPKVSGSPQKKSPTKLAGKTPKTPKSPRSKVEALKVLNKAKKFKQMDLKKNVVKKKSLTEEELAELKRIAEEERRLRLKQRELEKQIRKEERLQKIREQQEQRRLERLRQKEWLKPREDLLCENSKALPSPIPVKSSLPTELFGEAVMVMEFLHSFGPLFNIKEIIRGGVGFEDIEYAIMTEQVDSVLFEIIKFLLQAIFVAMEEEYEDHLSRAKKSVKRASEEPAGSPTENGGENKSEETKEGGNEGEEKMETEVVEGEEGVTKDQEEVAPGLNPDNEMEAMSSEEMKPLDVRIQGIIASAVTFSSWTHRTQRVPLNEMVLNPYTCSEVLRVHLLSSGGYTETSDRNWFRHSRRGGYGDADEPAIALRLQRPDLFDALARSSIYSVSPSNKLTVLSTLCSQLLTYSVTREYLDEACARAKKARRSIREIQFSEERRKKEEKAKLKKQQEAEKKKAEVASLASAPQPTATADPSNPVPQTTQEPSNTSMDTSTSEQKQTTESTSNQKDPCQSTNVQKDTSQSQAGDTSKSMDGDSSRPTQEDKKEEKSSKAVPPAQEEDEEEEDGDKETEEERKARIKEELFKLEEDLIEAEVAVNVKPLGNDRYHRSYWMFPSLPGLYVEDSRPSETRAEQQKQLSGSLKQEEATRNIENHPQPQASKMDAGGTLLSPGAVQVKSELNPLTQFSTGQSSLNQVIDLTTPPLPPPLIPLSELGQVINKEQSTATNGEIQTVKNEATASTPGTQTPKEATHPETPAQQSTDTKPATATDKVTWSCYTKPEEISSLLDSLNPRGLRELELKKNLEVKRLHIEPTLSKCPFRVKSPQPPLQLKYDSADEYLELYLREQILDIEEKIHIGNLGYLRDVERRADWRDAIENSGAAAIVPAPKSAKDKDSSALEGDGQQRSAPGSRSVSPWPGGEQGRKGTVTPLVDPSVRQLSKALLDVQAGIEKKYLMFPLGTAIDQKKRQKQKDKKMLKGSDPCLEEWRASLAKATSFSQIFVHLATLERAVMWSKSLMNVRCRICRRKCGDEFLLLCDGCDHGYHTYCLKPPLKNIPEGDWFCYECQPVTPIKPRRVKRVVFIEESSESEAEEENQESEDEGSEVVEQSGEEESEEEVDEGEEEEVGVAGRRSLRSRVEPTKTAAAAKKTSKKGKQGKRQTAATTQNVNKKTKVQAEKPQEQPVVKRGRGRPPKTSLTPPTTSVAGRGRKNSVQNSGSKENGSARKKLKLDDMQSPVHHSKAESVIAAMIDLKCQGSKQKTSAGRREQKGLEMQLCEAIWDEVNQRDESVHFAMPIKKREYPDYHDLIAEPMDLRTVKSKIKNSSYDGLDEFVQDIQLIFSNCLKYHKRHSDIGKAGTNLKRFFEKRCSDLGLKDLSLCGGAVLGDVDSAGGVSHRMSTRRRH